MVSPPSHQGLCSTQSLDLPVPSRVAPVKRTIGVFLSAVIHTSARIPPTMVEKVAKNKDVSAGHIRVHKRMITHSLQHRGRNEQQACHRRIRSQHNTVDILQYLGQRLVCYRVSKKLHLLTKSAPVAMKTGLLPLISEKGARTIGANPKPQVKTVMPTLYATSDTPHFSVSWKAGEAYDPAEYAAAILAEHESHVIQFFLVLDHENGLS